MKPSLLSLSTLLAIASVAHSARAELIDVRFEGSLEREFASSTFVPLWQEQLDFINALSIGDDFTFDIQYDTGAVATDLGGGPRFDSAFTLVSGSVGSISDFDGFSTYIMPSISGPFGDRRQTLSFTLYKTISPHASISVIFNATTRPLEGDEPLFTSLTQLPQAPFELDGLYGLTAEFRVWNSQNGPHYKHFVASELTGKSSLHVGGGEGPSAGLPGEGLTPVPEPSTYGLLGALALAAAAVWRRRAA